MRLKQNSEARKPRTHLVEIMYFDERGGKGREGKISSHMHVWCQKGKENDELKIKNKIQNPQVIIQKLGRQGCLEGRWDISPQENIFPP